jgi:hypothetical protein
VLPDDIFIPIIIDSKTIGIIVERADTFSELGVMICIYVFYLLRSFDTLRWWIMNEMIMSACVRIAIST